MSRKRSKRTYCEPEPKNGQQQEVLHLPPSPEAARLLEVIRMRSQGHKNVTDYEQRSAAKHQH